MAPPTEYSPAWVPARSCGSAWWLHLGPAPALSPQILAFFAASGLREGGRAWHPAGIRAQHCGGWKPAHPGPRHPRVHVRFPGTGHGAGLAGIQARGGTPARSPGPVGAGPRERGGLGPRMSPPPSYVRQLCSRRLRAPGRGGRWRGSCNLLVAKWNCGAEEGEAGTSPAAPNGEVSQLRGAPAAG